MKLFTILLLNEATSSNVMLLHVTELLSILDYLLLYYHKIQPTNLTIYYSDSDERQSVLEREDCRV